MRAFILAVSMALLPAQALAVSEEAKSARKRLDKLASDIQKGKYEDPQQLSEIVTQENERLLTYLETHPSDTDVALLLMEVYAVRQVVEFQEMAKMEDLPESLQVASGPYVVAREQMTTPYHAVLDRALAESPNNADLHAWKGRLYSLYEPLPDSTLSQLPLAIEELRRAAALAPNNETHREWLGILLLSADREAEAVAELKQIHKGKHPLYLLLQDWEAIPELGELSRDPRTENSFSEMMGESGQDFALVRYRAFVFPGTAAQLEELYRAKWPGFRLSAEPKTESDSNPNFGQYFRWKKGKLESQAKEYKDIPNDPDDGILLHVTEFHWTAEERAARPAGAYLHPAIANRDVYCDVLFSNQRTIKN